MAYSNKPQMTTGEAMAEARAMVIAAGIRGMRPVADTTGLSDFLTIEVDRAGRAVTASLYVKAERGDYVDGRWPGAPEGVRVQQSVIACEISWGGTSRSVARATANVDLYRELIAVAAEIEARFEGARIGDIIERR